MLARIKQLIQQAETRESFFRRIASFLPPMDPRYQAIKKAYDCAEREFQDRERKSGERYFEHLRAVALIVIDYFRIKNHVLIIAALLHDIVEDIPSWTIERVRAEFGDEVALLLSYLSKPPPEDYPSREERLRVYRSRFKNAPRDFFKLKLPDRLHNLLTMWNFDLERKKEKIEETRRYYLPYAEEHLILLHELEEALEELEKGINP